VSHLNSIFRLFKFKTPISFRRARKKLPKDIKKEVEKWKKSSGALVTCLVSYSDGTDVNTFQ
jgi:hypothetical protein